MEVRTTMTTNEQDSKVVGQLEFLGIKECTRCGAAGDDGEEYGVRGIARIGGNICVDCIMELSDYE